MLLWHTHDIGVVFSRTEQFSLWAPYNYILKTNTYIDVYMCKHLNISIWINLMIFAKLFFKPGCVVCGTIRLLSRKSPSAWILRWRTTVYLASDAAGTGRDRLTNETGWRVPIRGFNGRGPLGELRPVPSNVEIRLKQLYIVISGPKHKTSTWNCWS